MRSILSELWCGEINPKENIGPNDEYKEAQRAAMEEEAKFLKLLNAEQKEALERFNDSYADFDMIKQELIFTKGFRLGVRLLIEAMQND